MGILNSYYRAITEYKKSVGKDRNCVKLKETIKSQSAEIESITVTRNVCVIDEDWINAIEQGLVFVQKAIDENRQFIKTNGEVVPIEKAKHVSKDSVEHLARHSDLLTRKPEEEDDIIPDKIYNTERLTDFAVYENRFLYLLLTYLRDFIALRYDRILKLTNLYSGELRVKKSVHSAKQNIDYAVYLKEKREDDEFLRENNPCKDTILRIDAIYKLTLAFLKTPLMEEVAKTPKLRPPITKTNVLKMNRNFKAAVSLYEFVTAYEKQGFTVTEEVKKVDGFQGEAAENFSESIAATSFIAYQHGLDISGRLSSDYQAEEEQKKAAERQKLKEQVLALEKRVKASGQGIEEYMLALEKRNKMLEQGEEELILARRDNAALAATIAERDANVKDLNDKITEMNVAFAEKTEKMTAEFDEKFNAASLDAKRREEDIINACNDKLSEQENAFNIEKDNLLGKIDGAKQETAAALNANATLVRANQEKDATIHSLKDENVLCTAKYNGLRRRFNLIGENEDYTAEESFNEIEEQFIAFKKFFKEEWGKAKKRIRKEHLKFRDKKESVETTQAENNNFNGDRAAASEISATRAGDKQSGNGLNGGADNAKTGAENNDANITDKSE